MTYYLHQSGEWTTVLNYYFEWGTVEQVGELLSTFVSQPVMTVGFFDEEIFEWTIFQDGEARSRKLFCGMWAADEYELKPEVVDFTYLQEVIGIKRADLDRLFDSETPEQAVDALSEQLNVHLWIDFKFMDNDSESAKRYSRVDQDIRK